MRYCWKYYYEWRVSELHLRILPDQFRADNLKKCFEWVISCVKGWR